MKKAFFFLALIIISAPALVSARDLPEDFVAFYDVCTSRVNTCSKELPDDIAIFISWTSDTRYIVSFANRKHENITGVYDVEVKFRSDFDNVEIIALGEEVITPKKAENGVVTFDYNKEIVAGGYGKAFITLIKGEAVETQPSTTPPSITPPSTTTAPSTMTPPTTTQPPVVKPKITLPPETTTPSAIATESAETEEEAEEPIWKPLQGLIIVLALSAIVTIVLIKSGALEPPEID